MYTIKLKKYIHCNYLHNRVLEECESMLFMVYDKKCGYFYRYFDYKNELITGIVISNNIKQYIYKGDFLGYTEEEFNKKLKLLVFE